MPAGSTHRYTVHPNAYMVHREHPESEAKTSYQRQRYKARHPDNTDVLPPINEAWFTQQLLASGKYRPLLSSALQRCRSVLPHWAPAVGAMHA